MGELTVIQEQQAQIDAAREEVRVAQKYIEELQAQLKIVTADREGGVDLPLDEREKDRLILELDDTMDALDRSMDSLNEKVAGFTELAEVRAFPELRAEMKRSKGEIKTAAADLKKEKELLAKTTAIQERARVELNEEGYADFVRKTNEKITFTEERIAEIRGDRTPDEEELAFQEATLVALQNQLRTAEEAQGVLAENLSIATAQKRVHKTEVTRLTGVFNDAIIRMDGHLLAYHKINDPRYLVNELNDNTPFLLMPVRVETRYMTVKHVRRNEPAVVEEAEEAVVAASRGASRRESREEVSREEAAPLYVSIPDKKELWLRFFPDDLATSTHEERLTEDEQNAGETYWKAFWNPEIVPGSDVDHELGAWRLLVGGYGPQRAAWIAKETEPTNLAADHSVEDPEFPILTNKPAAWTEAAKSHVLPDRFVVRIYSDDTTYREVVGKSIPDPLTLGISPDESDDFEFEQAEGEVDFPEEIKWLSDFETAKNVGMAVSIPLQAEEEAGIHRILVLGLKLSADKDEATTLFENLIEGHHYTDGGFSLIPQGTPTNNTEDLKAGYEAIESDPEASFRIERKGDLFNIESGLLEKTDGQWFANLVGVNTDVIQNIYHANGTDVCEAIAMNKSLWPATMGYYLKQMLHPHISLADQRKAKNFFNTYVTGRGKIPAFRVDDQPYGIIPATVYSRWKYPEVASSTVKFYDRMFNRVLKPMNTVWGMLANDYVKNVDITSPAANPSSEFLEMMGLHASSVEFHQRFANGAYKMWNIWRFLNEADGVDVPISFPAIDGGLISGFLDVYNGHLSMSLVEPPKIFELNFLDDQRLLNGPVIDGFNQLPYSEERGIQPFPDTEWNYIHWLLDPSTTIGRVRLEQFNNMAGIPVSQKPPKALLYLLLRHAYLMEYLNTSTGILVDSGVISVAAELEVEMQSLAPEGTITAEEKAQVFSKVSEEFTLAKKAEIKLRVAEEFSRDPDVARRTIRAREVELFSEESRDLAVAIEREYGTRLDRYESDQKKWNYLTEPIEAVSGRQTMEAYIDGLVEADSLLTGDLSSLKASIEKLKDLPTARLERAFAEHLDLCNYRLDGWLNGLVTERLEQQQGADRGMYLGSFGILENLKPNASFPGIHVIEVNGSGTVLETSPEVTDGFTYIGEAPVPLERDPESGKVRALPTIDATNQGFIHTPSVNHAVTAAILRAGYLSHLAADSDDDTLAVNLTSQRIRKALYYLEGIQNGQTLPALLGYRFERSLHDRSAEFGNDPLTNNLDQYILDIRLAYPLTAGGVLPTESDEAIETQEARNVVDGLALIDAYELDNTILNDIITNTTHRNEVIEVIDEIRNDMDAIADLLLSESVYQLSRGNMERSSAVLKALSEGGFVQEPEIIKTPRGGHALTHRFGIQFDPLKTAANHWTTDGTPRSIAEPALNGWLYEQLPDPSKVLFNIDHVVMDGETEVVTPEQLSLSDLGIEPIDLVHLIGDQGNDQDAAELSSHLAYLIIKHEAMTDEATVRISYLNRVGFDDDELSLFQLLPLLRELKKMIGNSRPLEVTDYQMAADSQGGTPADIHFTNLSTTAVETRLSTAAGITPGFAGNLSALMDQLDTAIADGGEPGTAMPADPVVTLDYLREKIMKAATFGVAHVFPKTVFDNSEAERDNLVKTAKRVKAILLARYNKVDDLFDDLAGVTETKVRNAKLTEIGQILFGRSFKVYPDFELKNAAEVILSRTNTSLFAEVGDLAPEEWLQGVAKVRTKMTNYQKVRLFADSLTNTNNSDLSVTQLPVVSATDDRWIGMTLPEDYDVPGDTLSLVLELPENTDPTVLQAGMVLDEWTETIPAKNVHTGVAMHYNQPNAEAPNSLIMAVTPEVTGSWEWDDLMDTLKETLDLAKKRAVEPDHLKEKIWGQALPALIASVSANDSTPSLDFGRNIVNVSNGQFGHIFPAAYDAVDFSE